MLILSGANDIIRVNCGSAASVDYVIDWLKADDVTPPGIEALQPSSHGNITSSGNTTVLSAPGASKNANVKTMRFTNTHASTSTTFRVERYDGTNARQASPYNITLLPGESLHMDECGAWWYYGSGGAVKPYASKLDVMLTMSSDAVNATTAFADITGFTYPLLSGKTYAFDARLHVICNATTTGARFGVNIGATPTDLGVGGIAVVTNSATASAISSGYATAVDTACTGVQTTGPAAEGHVTIAGRITPSADGTFALRFQSEVAVAAGVTVRYKGSWLRITEKT